jgi:DNA-nicking Smr family endonuclease
MDFGKILNQWETQGQQVYDKDRFEQKTETAPERRRRLLRKRPDETIDLHGLTRDEAWGRLDLFFQDAKAKGLEKVLIIHGKGNHTVETPEGPEPSASAEGILKRMVQDFIEHCSFAGESGYSNAADGGTGSTWVLLKAGN